jgi:hypothetical protein
VRQLGHEAPCVAQGASWVCEARRQTPLRVKAREDVDLHDLAAPCAQHALEAEVVEDPTCVLACASDFMASRTRRSHLLLSFVVVTTPL